MTQTNALIEISLAAGSTRWALLSLQEKVCVSIEEEINVRSWT